MSRNHFTFAVDRLICRASGLPEDRDDEEEDEEQEDGADGDDDEDGDNEDDEEGLVLLV